MVNEADVSKGLMAVMFLVIGTATAAASNKNDCAQFGGDAALTACEKAIDENPNDPFPYFYRGVEYDNMGSVDRAITNYDKAIVLNPKIAVFYNNRGNAWQDKGDLKRAIADYDKAIALNPELESAYLNRGNYFRNKGDYDRAIADYNQAIRLDPQNAGSLNGRCRTFALANRELRQALDDCDAALRIAPHDPDICNSRGLVQLKVGAFDKAAADYGIAAAENPKDADSLYGHGLAERGLGNEAAATAEIAAAKAIRPDIADVYAYYFQR
jgi:tetratricopeptide (TPR) repeat protein